ncbi:hypothetical protein [Emticicia sp. SJ17W-69]|uniref:hypothetical protein n=1 Tax=Emticicia sp. SJ17W-69 TaxID=3421657 RepID=UPI003EBADE2E
MPLLLALFIIIGLFLLHKNNPINGLRVAVLKALLTYSVFVFFITEILGNLCLLYSTYITGTYLLFAFSIFLYLFYKRILQIHQPFFSSKIYSESIYNFFPKSIFAFFLLIVLTLLFLTIYITPNNTDALGYHIARAMFWIQNQNLFHYPTSSAYQLYYNVFSEYLLLHTIVLSGGDGFVNSVHFVAFIGTLFATSLIGKNFGMSKKGQGIVAIITCTVPMGILQATTSQNDYLSSFFFCCTLYFGLLLFEKTTESFQENFKWAILSLLLAGFTKYSIFMYGLGFIAFFGIYLLKTDWLKSIKIGFVSIGLFLVTFSAFFYRNYIVFGNILMPNAKSMLYYNYKNEELGIKVTLSNLSKIIGNHIGLPFNSWNYAYDKLIAKFHDLIGFDLNNSHTTFASYFTIFSIGEDFSGNFIHFFLIIFCGIWLIIHFKKKEDNQRLVLLYFALLFVGLIAYASAFKWQTFHSRTQLPFFLAATPVIGFVLVELSKKYRWLRNATVLLLMIAALPYIYCNSLKPIMPMAYYFKKMLVYVPYSIGDNETALKKEQYQKLVEKGLYQETILHFSSKAYNITPNLTRNQRKEIFAMLDSTTYYDFVKHNVFERKEWKQGYFTFDDQTYQNFKGIFTFLRNNDYQIGLATNSQMIHPFFMFGRDKYGDKFKLSYIQYPQDLQYCYNAKRPFTYTAIITDDKTLVKRLENKIFSKKSFGQFDVLLFQNSQNDIFLQ